MHKFTFFPDTESFHCNGVPINPLSVERIYVEAVATPMAKTKGRTDFTSQVFCVMVDQKPIEHCLYESCVLTCLKRDVAENLERLLQELVRLKKKLSP